MALLAIAWGVLAIFPRRPHWRSYTKDTFENLVWRWKYNPRTRSEEDVLDSIERLIEQKLDNGTWRTAVEHPPNARRLLNPWI
jgi:hypothetical protein